MDKIFFSIATSLTERFSFSACLAILLDSKYPMYGVKKVAKEGFLFRYSAHLLEFTFIPWTHFFLKIGKLRIDNKSTGHQDDGQRKLEDNKDGPEHGLTTAGLAESPENHSGTKGREMHGRITPCDKGNNAH